MGQIVIHFNEMCQLFDYGLSVGQCAVLPEDKGKGIKVPLIVVIVVMVTISMMLGGNCFRLVP